MSDTAPAAEQTVTEPNGDATTTTTEPNGQLEDIDYKAKYEEAIGHSRTWEQRAKENKAARDELEQLKEAQKTDEQKRQEREAERDRELAVLRAEKQQREWAQDVAQTTGVPAEVLRGSTLEEIEQHAALLAPAYEKPKPAADPVTSIAQQPRIGNVSLTDQIAAAEQAGEKALVAALKAQKLAATN